MTDDLIEAVSAQLPVVGVCVVDVVEGTALQALEHMSAVIEHRPRSFPDINRAIEWSLKSGGTKNIASARVSIPDQLVRLDTSDQPTYVWRTNLKATQPFWQGIMIPCRLGMILLVIIIFLRICASHVCIPAGLTVADAGWFTGLSELFLKVPAAKMLLLADTDRLDKPLTIAQVLTAFTCVLFIDLSVKLDECITDARKV